MWYSVTMKIEIETAIDEAKANKTGIPYDILGTLTLDELEALMDRVQNDWPEVLVNSIRKAYFAAREDR